MGKGLYIKTIILILLAISGITVYSQSSEYNYIMRVSPLSGSTSTPGAFYDVSVVDVDYYDGLGRLTSHVSVGSSGDYMDMCDYRTYDHRGRVSCQYLPILTSNNDGRMPSGYLPTLSQDYYGDSYAYRETEYDVINPERITREVGPGEAWHSGNRTQEVRYRYNDQSVTYGCVLYDVNATGQLVNKGKYNSGTLRVTETEDENGDITLEFTDKGGRKLLQRRLQGATTADTYWVYDIYGLLRYVLSPQASTLMTVQGTMSENNINSLCYKYVYDERGRCIESKLPGVATVYYVYDKLNRVVLSQDGEQRATSEWRVTKYDRHHRLAVEGRAILTGETRAGLQSEWGDKLMEETYTPSLGMEYQLMYTNSCGPANFTADRAYYYDDYSHWEDYVPIPTDSRYRDCTGMSAQGMLTGEAVTDYSGNIYVTLHVKDEKGNEVLCAKRDLWGQDYLYATFTRYDFRNNPVSRNYLYQRLSEQEAYETHVIESTYSYDNRDRMVMCSHRYGSGSACYNYLTYDDHGRVVRSGISKHRSEYSYDIRNRQTSHTSPSFSQMLEYESPSVEGAQARYDGSLSAIKETRYVDTIPEWHSRKIYYDQSGQITEIDDSDSLRMNESYEYDLNGNITRIRRGAPGELYDDVYLGYTGNRLTYVVDDADYDSYLGEIAQYSSSNFLDTLTYDSKGRLLSDHSQGIREISYYPNDLPREILMTNAEKLINTYHSDGSKHSDYRRIRYMKTVMQIDANGDTVYVEQPAYKTIYRYYVGNSVREDNAPTRFYTEDGYFEYYRGVATFHYYVRDYFGSIRAIVNTDGDVEQTVDYLSTGIPIKGGKGEIIDDRLHTGKQYLSLNGSLLYDNIARYYSPVHGRFITPDALSSTYPHISHYAHCANNPLSIIDPTGNYLESAWDAVNIGLGISSLWNNIKEGNVGAAIVDGVGVVVDAVAMALPVVPGGASSFIKAARAADDVVDVAKTTSKVADKAADVVKMEKHHIIPKQLMDHPLVKEAISEGFKFNGPDNIISLEKYVKNTNTGRHGNHPAYNDKVRQLLNESSNGKGTASERLHNVIDNVRTEIETKPDIKINDLYK